MSSRSNGRDSFPSDAKPNMRSVSPRDVAPKDSVRTKSKHGLNGSNSIGVSSSKASPINSSKTRAASGSAGGASSGNAAMTNQDTSAEKVLCDLLFGAQAVILKSRAHESSHELERVLFYVNDRAKEIVEYELSAMISNLVELMGANPKHRMTAYSKIGESLLSQMEAMILSNDTQRLKRLEQDHSAIREQSDTMYRELSQVIASKDLEIARYKEQQLSMDDKLRSMSQTNTSLQLEIEKLLRDRIQTHQNSVELRMQGLDFKAEVDRRCGSILNCVQSRMGFVPSTIEKQVDLLKSLKAPGDPSYDTSRHFKAMRQPSDAPPGNNNNASTGHSGNGGNGSGAAATGGGGRSSHASGWVSPTSAAREDELVLGEEGSEDAAGESAGDRYHHQQRRSVSSLAPSSPIQGRTRASRQSGGNEGADRYQNPLSFEGVMNVDRRASPGRDQSAAERVAARRPQSAPGNRVGGSSYTSSPPPAIQVPSVSVSFTSKSPRYASPTPISPTSAGATATGDSSELAKRIISRNAGFVDISSAPHSSTASRISPSRAQSAAGRYNSTSTSSSNMDRDTREGRSNSDSTNRSSSSSASASSSIY